VYWPAFRQELRHRMAVAAAGVPFVMVLGIAAGGAAARAQGVPPWPAIRLSLAVFVVLLLASHILDAAAAAALRVVDRPAWQQAVSLAIDAAVGSRIGKMAAVMSGTDETAGVAIGAVMLPIYNLIVRKLALGELGDAIGDFMLLPRGGSGKPEYSRADALAARGRFDEAIAALIEEAGGVDGATCLRAARLMRDSAKRYDASAEWLRRAIGAASDPAQEATAVRELTELYSHRMHCAERAAPFLARLVSHQPETAAGIWAARELADIRRTLAEQER
jgi:hypothetical protein